MCNQHLKLSPASQCSCALQKCVFSSFVSVQCCSCQKSYTHSCNNQHNVKANLMLKLAQYRGHSGDVGLWMLGWHIKDKLYLKDIAICSCTGTPDAQNGSGVETLLQRKCETFQWIWNFQTLNQTATRPHKGAVNVMYLLCHVQSAVKRLIQHQHSPCECPHTII